MNVCEGVGRGGVGVVDARGRNLSWRSPAFFSGAPAPEVRIAAASLHLPIADDYISYIAHCAASRRLLPPRTLSPGHTPPLHPQSALARINHRHVQTHTRPAGHNTAPPSVAQAGRQGVLQGQPRRINGHNQPLRQLHARLGQDQDLCVSRAGDQERGGASQVTLHSQIHTPPASQPARPC